jgi:hypothetical protein
MALHDVVLGATIDGYAVEGGFDDADGPATSFGIAQSLGRIRPSVRSPGTFEHLAELITRAAQLGVGEVRLTLEWARLEPRPGDHDDDAIARYVAALEAAADASMSTVVVLCDAAWPSWLGQEPWLSAWAPQRFASHARWVAERVDGLARAVVTFRNPNAAAREGWLTASRPPFRRHARADATSALDGMLVAHQRAVDEMASVAPALSRAIALEARRAHEEGVFWRDVARSGGEPGQLAARRRAWDAAVPRRGRLRAVAPPRRRVDAAALRSTAGWASCAPFEWWLGGDDVELLAAALEHEDGDVGTVELGAGPAGWDAQLATALPALAAVADGVRNVHLHGLVSSTGPLAAPVGLLDVDQHSGDWSVEGPEDGVARRLSGRWR